MSGALALGGEAIAAPLHAPVAPEDLLRPLAPGAKFGRWEVERIGALDLGAIIVGVRDARGSFELEVLAKDTSPLMPTAPGVTEHFAVYVVNSGSGAAPTDEEHGLCAMTLATIIAKNEGPAAANGFATLSERLDFERRGGLLRRA